MTGWKRAQSSLLVFAASAFVLAALALLDSPGWLIALIAFAWFAFMTFGPIFPEAPPEAEITVLPAVTLNEKKIIEKFIEALPDPCLLVDRSGRVAAFNRKLADFVPQLHKGNLFSFHLRWPALNDAVVQAFNGKASWVDIEEKIPIERWTSFFACPLNLSSGAMPDHACVTIHDRTEHKRSERMRVDFVANASHELRTPLASLLGFVETLQGPARHDEKSREKFLNIMQQQAQRMSRLIEDLLSLSRIEMHAHIQPETRLDLVPLLQTTLESLKPLAGQRGVALNFRKTADCFIVRGDRDELFRAFENLIENAVKYGESGKKVDVDIAQDANLISVNIRDYGPGIAEAHLSRLTERFYRVDEENSREKGGTGLGLAIVKHILNRHRGSLEIKSIIGQGSVFTALLPKAV